MDLYPGLIGIKLINLRIKSIAFNPGIDRDRFDAGINSTVMKLGIKMIAIDPGIESIVIKRGMNQSRSIDPGGQIDCDRSNQGFGLIAINPRFRD